MFEEINQETFDSREKRILQFWQNQRIFERSVEDKKDCPLFSFYDGPPFATGLPHYGHLLAGTIKDVVPRYKTMKGFWVPRRFGWDCHGLPIEHEIEKAQELSGATSIETFGIARFNEECRKIVLRYTEEWKSIVNRMGRWVDFNNTYHTMDLSFMESVWWVFKQLYEKGLVYEGYKVMPFSAKLGTPLSNFEAGENYQEVDDPALTVAFRLVDDLNTSFLAWTTTPWTLISNLALLVGPEITYVKIHDKKRDHNYILAESRVSSYYKENEEYEILQRFKGSDLLGWKYEPLFPYFADRAQEGAFRVVPEDSVSLEEGTGIVHCAPAFGEVDFFACKAANIDLVCPVDNNGCFTNEIPEYAGEFVKDADKEIIQRLKHQNSVFHHGVCRHRYPFCWRSDTPLIYKAVSSWFVSVEKFKDVLVAVNREIHWTPAHIKYGRFGKWLEGARDWAISRNRYWGTPIPIWRSSEGELLVIGSLQELEAATKTKVTDLHRHYIDHLVITKNGKKFTRIPEVFDCWFESGSMPYAQNHYPFENRALFEANFPADFIGEGIDQTRGWFYTLTILSAALFRKPAFRNVIVNGIVLAENGEKMSKRLRNYPDPMDVVHRYGADAIRLYMLSSPAVRGDDLCFSEGGVELVLRQVLLPLWNAYSFFITYARIYKWLPKENIPRTALIDHWILSQLQKLIRSVEEGMDDYDLNRAVEPLVGFIDSLTNWYIRRSRRRFWEDKDSPDRQQAFATLYEVLLTFVQVAAPFIPFIADAIYLNLRKESMPESVHLCAYPAYRTEVRDEHLERGMSALQTATSLGHSLRKEHKLKVRQPLAKAFIATQQKEILDFLQDQKHLIAEELNVKEVEFSEDEHQFVRLQAKPNFRTLGKKVGKLMPAVQKAIDTLPQSDLNRLLEGNSVEVVAEGESVTITTDDVQVSRQIQPGVVAANESVITIALDTSLNEELLLEGLARELVNKLNTMRREMNLHVSDRIDITLDTTSRMKHCFEAYRDYICRETLTLSVTFEKCEGTIWDLNGEPTTIHIQSVGV